MKTTKALFFELMYDFQSERWNEFELPNLSLRELLAVAPKSTSDNVQQDEMHRNECHEDH